MDSHLRLCDTLPFMVLIRCECYLVGGSGKIRIPILESGATRTLRETTLKRESCARFKYGLRAEKRLMTYIATASLFSGANSDGHRFSSGLSMGHCGAVDGLRSSSTYHSARWATSCLKSSESSVEYTRGVHCVRKHAGPLQCGIACRMLSNKCTYIGRDNLMCVHVDR